MIRALLVLAGIALFVAGLIGTAVSFAVNGWTVLAGVGVCLLWVDVVLEDRARVASATRRLES